MSETFMLWVEAQMGVPLLWFGSEPQSFASCLFAARLRRNRGTSWHIDRHDGSQSVTIARSVFGGNMRAKQLTTAPPANDGNGDSVEFITGDFDALIKDAMSKHGELLERLEDGDSLDTARAAYAAAKLMANTPHKDIDLRLRLRWEADAATAYALALEADNKRLSNERELLLRYGRAMHEDMQQEGLNTITMMQMKAMLDKEDADHAK